MKKNINILITAIGCNMAISVIKALRLSKRYKYKIVGADIHRSFEVGGSSLCDRHYKILPAKNKAYIGNLIKICKKEKIKVLIPILDEEVEKISLNKNIFESRGIKTCASSHNTVLACNDKYKTYQVLKEKGVEVPRVDLAKRSARLVVGLQYPIFIKPRKGASSRDCFRANNRDEAKIFFKRIKDPVVQPYLTGQHCVIDVVNDLSGKNLVSIPRYEFSAKAGIGVKAKIVRDISLIKYGKLISESLNIKGAANIELFKKNNQIKLIEINPRFSAGTILSAISGVNMPEITIDLFRGKKIDAKRLKWKAGYYMSRYWQEVFSFKGKIMGPMGYGVYCDT